eukprot:403371440
MDSKEPKEKHVFFIIECLRGSIPSITPREAMTKIIERFLKNIGSWACTTKIFIILHRCLQDPGLSQKMAQELKSKEHLLHSYQKKASDQSYEAKMYAEVSQLYNAYIKFYYNTKLQSSVLNCRMTEVSPKLKSYNIQDLLKNYENFDALISEIFAIFEHQNFAKRTRLLSNVIYLLFQDLIQIYKVFYVLVTEILERFTDLQIDLAKKAFVVYQNFVNLTQTMRSKCNFIMAEFNFTVKLPEFYQPDPVLVQTLKICIEEKQSNPSKLDNVSKQLRGGMNRNQFQTNYAQGGAPKDELFSAEDYIYKTFQQQQQNQDSDSGEDFDYGEEDEEEEDIDVQVNDNAYRQSEYKPSNQDTNIDLMQFISNMDIPVQQSSNSSSTTTSVQNNSASHNQSSLLDDLFFGGGTQTQQVQQPAPIPTNSYQTAINIQNNNISLQGGQPLTGFFDNFNQNQNPNFQVQQQQQQQQPKPIGQDPFFDFNKPLITSTGINHIQQQNQMDTFKTLYTSVASTQPNQVQTQQQQQVPSQQQLHQQQFQSNLFNNQGAFNNQPMGIGMAMNTNLGSQFMTNSMGGMPGNMAMQMNTQGFPQNFQSNMGYMGNNQFGTQQQQQPFMNGGMNTGMQTGYPTNQMQQQQQQFSNNNGMGMGMNTNPNSNINSNQFMTNQFNTSQMNNNNNSAPNSNEFSFW